MGEDTTVVLHGQGTQPPPSRNIMNQISEGEEMVHYGGICAAERRAHGASGEAGSDKKATKGREHLDGISKLTLGESTR